MVRPMEPQTVSNCCWDISGLPQLSDSVTKKAPEGAICDTERSSMNINSVYTSARSLRL